MPLPGVVAISILGRAMILIILTTAIIFGMLAMHSFASPSSHSGMPINAEHSMVSAESEQSAATPASDCAGCTDDMSMSTMGCVLALLTATLLLIAPRSIKLWRRRVRRLLPPSESHHRFIWLIPRPPSLNVLCISRT